MIHVRHLRLRSITASRIYGADIPLKPGLNVIQANNTSGKSTSLQAIIYALGLERSLGPQLSIPLPYAMRERIHPTKDAPYEHVLQSYVEIEIENGKKQSLVIRRDIVGGKDTKLVQTWNQGSLGQGGKRGEQRDFFVHDGGAAQREDGFHTFLTSFIGWELPVVPRFDGTEGPLYLEAITPMLFVEQKRGWSAIQGPFPTFLKIQDVARRVMEFLLDLDAGKIRRQRTELRNAIASVSQRWADHRQLLEDQAQRVGRLRGIPIQPSAEFALAPDMKLELFRNDEWLPIDEVVSETKARISELEATQVETTENAAPELLKRLETVRRVIDDLSAQAEVVRSELSSEHQEQQAIRARLESLSADLRRNQDALKLRKLGSDLGQAAGEHVCPTCHQDVGNELLPVVENVGMGLEENITFVKSQIDLYGTALQSAVQRVQDCQARYRGTEEELQERQAELRSLRQALLQPNSAPSRVVIEEIVRTQAFVERIGSLDEAADIAGAELQRLAKEWSELQEAMKQLPADELTWADREKIDAFQASIQGQLENYGFRSFQPTEIILSRDNFRPLAVTRGQDGAFIEQEIGYEVSASDAIRLKWAYYLALLRLAAVKSTNHTGVVIFDEPGQQEIEAQALYALLANAAEQGSISQQVIVSTSEPLEHIRSVVGSQAHIVSFAGFILQPLPTVEEARG